MLAQVLLNIRRRSTVGWNVDNVILDCTGGTLSLAQLLLDAGCTGEWGDMVGGDPVKFGLGFLSIFFDVIFMVQHFVLYREPRKLQLHHVHGSAPSDTPQPLLAAEHTSSTMVTVSVDPVRGDT